jgi:hypothetical protein
MMTSNNYATLSVEQLKTELRKRKMKLAGRKSELIERFV